VGGGWFCWLAEQQRYRAFLRTHNRTTTSTHSIAHSYATQAQLEQDILVTVEEAKKSGGAPSSSSSSSSSTAAAAASTSRKQSAPDQQQQQQLTSRHSNGAGDDDGPAKAPVLVPAIARDIKSDVALPRRDRRLQRSRTSSLVDYVDDASLRELARPIEPVLTAPEPREALRRFIDKVGR
jgi:hypothetical protein